MTSTPSISLRRLALACALAAGAPMAAWAAGGHHAVDDAELLEAGRCKVESWFTRESGDARLLHVGTGCRVGPVELSGAGEYARDRGNSQTDWGLGVKWAGELSPQLSVGAALSPGWQARARPRYQGATLAGLLTWKATDAVRLHANAGRDFVHRGGDEPRHGVSIDWTPREGWMLMAERYREEGGHFLRAGLRWTPAEDWSLDLSRAHHLRGTGASAWTVALTREFGR